MKITWDYQINPDNSVEFTCYWARCSPPPMFNTFETKEDAEVFAKATLRHMELNGGEFPNMCDEDVINRLKVG